MACTRSTASFLGVNTWCIVFILGFLGAFQVQISAETAVPFPFYPLWTRRVPARLSQLPAPRVHNYSHKVKAPSKLVEYAIDRYTVFIDVRSEPELRAPPFLQREYLHIPVTLTDTSPIMFCRELPKDHHTPIVVFSGWVGGRAFGAKTTLEKMGYDHVINGGGVRDVVAACAQQKRNAIHRMNDMLKHLGAMIHFD